MNVLVNVMGSNWYVKFMCFRSSSFRIVGSLRGYLAGVTEVREGEEGGGEEGGGEEERR